MKCEHCNGEVIAERGQHKYRVAGLDVTLVGIPIERCGICGSVEVVIPSMEALHNTIAAAVMKLPFLDAAGVRFLRKHLGWSLEDMAREMGVSVSTAEAWERGEAVMGASESGFRKLVETVKPIDDYEDHNGRTLKPTPLRARTLKATLENREWRAEAVL